VRGGRRRASRSIRPFHKKLKYPATIPQTTHPSPLTVTPTNPFCSEPMNIFALHPSPRRSARWHADKHVVKMLLEAVQMLYSAHWIAAYPFLLAHRSVMAVSRAQQSLLVPPSIRFAGGGAPFQKMDPSNRGFRPVHLHHPCTRWVRTSLENYRWLSKLTLELAREHRHRWPSNPPPSCEAHALWLAAHPPLLPRIPRTPFAIAMPVEYRKSDPIVSYRAFYRGSKQDRGITDRYTNRHRPHWL
jgi:hypothetical protein